MTVPAAENLRRIASWEVMRGVGGNTIAAAADLLDAIDALHQPEDVSTLLRGDNGLMLRLVDGHGLPATEFMTVCNHDAYSWPCPTARLLHPAPKEDK